MFFFVLFIFSYSAFFPSYITLMFIFFIWGTQEVYNLQDGWSQEEYHFLGVGVENEGKKLF